MKPVPEERTDTVDAGLPAEWVVKLGAPALVASGFFAVNLATEDGPSWLHSLLFAPVILLPMTWIALLAQLALASDTNGRPGATVAQIEPRAASRRRAA